MSKGFASNYRAVVLAGFVLASFGGIGARLVWLQAVHRGPLLDYVEKRRRQIIVESGRRGDILDAHDNILATSRSLIVLGVDPQALRPEDQPKWPQLAELIGMPLAQLQTILTTRFRPIAPVAGASPTWGLGIASNAGWLVPSGTASPGENRIPAKGRGLVLNPSADQNRDDEVLDDPDESGNRPIRWAKLCDNLPESAYAAVQKLGILGVYGDRVYRRDYPHNELAAHVIGYVSREEQQPIAGMEHYADFYLRGQDGWIESEKDGRRVELAQFRSREVPAADGYAVKLSIDSEVQHIAEAELDRIVEKFQPLKATIIVSDPRTGFVLALANYPTFNLNSYNELTPEEQNRMQDIAVADEYDPGSVFKIVPAAAALNDGLVTPDTTFDVTLTEAPDRNGRMHGLPREDASDHFVNPKAFSVRQIIAKSSDKGAAQLALALGDDRFYSYVRAFGFGSSTGFPIGGEIRGDVLPPSRWDGLTITRMAIGQSVSATPLQMQQAMGVIASGGELLRPQIISQIRDPQGEIVFRFGRASVHRVISERTAKVMARLLMGVASPEGTAPAAAIPGYEVAGKTGTAQKLMPETTPSGKTVMRYSQWHHVGSFVGFFPASDPQVAIAVIVDDADARSPGRVAHGAVVAAPYFHDIGEQLIPYLNIRPPGARTPPEVLAMQGGRP